MSNPYYFNPFFDAPEPEPILREAFSGWDEGNGIFSALSKVGQPPWRGIESITDASLDLEYFGNHSGGKFCAPIVKLFLKDGSVPEAKRESIARILLAKYQYNWQRLWDTNVIAYEPIYNYNMYENRNLVRSEDESRTTEGESKQTGTDTLTHGRIESTDKTNTQVLAREQENDSTDNRTDTTEHGKTDTVEHDTTETVTHDTTSTLTKDDTETTAHGHTTDELTSRYGLNTEGTPKPSDDVKTTEGGTTKVDTTGTNTTKDSGTDSTAMTGTDTTTEGGTTKLTSEDTAKETEKENSTNAESGTTKTTTSGDDVTTKDLTDTNNVTETRDNDGMESESTHRYGNIGVTTSQKMLADEREVWMWNFFDQVFADLDKELTLAFHDPCRV